jgi:hypothetical protein
VSHCRAKHLCFILNHSFIRTLASAYNNMVENYKRIPAAVLCIFLLSTEAFAQTGGIVAGQTAGMRVTYPSNLSFYTSNQAPHLSHQLDVDGDGISDFNLYHEIASVNSIQLRPVSPNEWEVLNTSASTYSLLATPVPYAVAIEASSPQASWGSYGYLRHISQNAGISYPSGAWAPDTVTRYIGIRQLKNNQWRYGYLKTKRLLANDASAPLFVTACAIQSVVTGTRQERWAQVEVYPNPVQAILQVDGPHRGRLLIYNSVGALQHEEQMTTEATQVAVANWAAGIYVIKIENQDGVYTSRFQKLQ